MKYLRYLLFINILFIFVLFLYIYTCKCKIFVELSAHSINYLAYLPIVVKAWNIIGFSSIVFITYNNLNKEIVYIRNTLVKLGSDVILLNFNNSFSLQYTSKLIRIFGYEVSKRVKNCDYLLISDADMIPISKSFFYDFNYNKLTIKSFDKNGYGYGNNKGRWAMCYFVANKFIWKSIINYYEKIIDIRDYIYNIINYEVKKGEKYFENFAFIDEVYMRDKIKKWKYFNTKVIYHPRNYSNTRIDRKFWPKNIYTIERSKIIDIHLPKYPLKESEIKKLWVKKIIPLQLYLFSYIPFDIDYINTIFLLNKTL